MYILCMKSIDLGPREGFHETYKSPAMYRYFQNQANCIPSSTEQPDAPSSEGNTAPQEPRLDGAKTDPTREDLIADTKADDIDRENTTSSAPILVLPTLTSSALSPVPVAGAPSSSTPAEAGASTSSTTAQADAPLSLTPVEAGASSSSTTAQADAPLSLTPVEAGASSSSTTAQADAPLSLTPAEAGGSSAATSEPKTEQRSTETTEGQSSQASYAADHHEVSEEALKGPQGPVPSHAEDFEKEAKGIKPAKKDGGSVENDSSKSTDKSSQGSDKGNGNGKQSPLHKMKEKLSKVAHPRHGSNKA
jgi:hypothetical protein